MSFSDEVWANDVDAGKMVLNANEVPRTIVASFFDIFSIPFTKILRLANASSFF